MISQGRESAASWLRRELWRGDVYVWGRSERPLHADSGNSAMMLAESSLHADATIYFEHFHAQTDLNKTLHDGAPEQVPEWQH